MWVGVLPPRVSATSSILFTCGEKAGKNCGERAGWGDVSQTVSTKSPKTFNFFLSILLIDGSSIHALRPSCASYTCIGALRQKNQWQKNKPWWQKKRTFGKQQLPPFRS